LGFIIISADFRVLDEQYIRPIFISKEIDVAFAKKTAIYSIRIILLVATLAGLVVASEYAARYIFRDITTTGDNGSYFAKKWRLEQFGRSCAECNSLGYREREFEKAKPENTYRIAVIGDSLTYGQGIPDEERFSNRLESELTGSEMKYQVLNFGAAGADFVHHINTSKRVLELEPDFILLQWYVNDFEGPNPQGRPSARNLAPTMELHLRLHQSSALYYVLNAGWHATQRFMGTVGSYETYMNQHFLDPNSEGSKSALAKLKTVFRLANDRNVPIGMVLFPRLRPYLADDYPFDYLHERIISLCKQNDIPYVDLREDFKSYGSDIRRLHVNQYDAHPNGLANEIAAKRIMEVFGPIWRGH
jgi:lysophospholipase L1-like esterase